MGREEKDSFSNCKRLPVLIKDQVTDQAVLKIWLASFQTQIKVSESLPRAE